MKELKAINDAGDESYEVSTPNPQNPFQWEVVLMGPEGTPYEDGMFFVEIEFSPSHPASPPKKVKVTTKIYHPNIDAKGQVCLEGIRKAWTSDKANSNAKFLIDYLYGLLKQPDADDALVSEIAQQYKTKREAYNKTAKEWCEEYAQ